MIDIEKYPLLANCITTLKDTSIDKSNNEVVYMTESPRQAVNFDEVKEKYIKNLKLSETPKSNDALFDNGKGFLVFVEFKNGYIDKQRQFALRKKIYDSVVIFSDITSESISDMRKNVGYILVYNEGTNADNKDSEFIKKKREHVQYSSSFNNIAQNLSKLARKEYICFGLELFKNYCFKEVHTYTIEEFEEYLTKL